jgi:hypothetical protein
MPMQVSCKHNQAEHATPQCQLSTVPAATHALRRFLLDLEMCVREDQGALPAAGLASWDAGTLVDGRYVAASDLYELGRMLQDHHLCVTSAQGRQFLDLLARPARALQADGVTAGALLGHPWLQHP